MDSVARRDGRPRGHRSDPDGWSALRAEAAADAVDPEDPWAWAAREREAPSPVDVSGAYVTAVLVAIDAGRWLPETLRALAALQPKPARLIAIDNGSLDGTRVMLDLAVDSGVLDAVYAGQRSFGFGTAVKSALRQDRQARGGVDDDTYAEVRHLGGDESHWLWLLHDDATPSPDALYQLLAHVAADPRIDITGPKLLLPRRRLTGQPISEVGISISNTGRRELGLEPGEIDQGQRDQPQPRLGVSTCGMLVRTAVWQDLDGLDPAVPVFRDGVEFGWRAHLNGYRVVTTPAAVMTHRQVGRAGLRPKALTGRRPGKLDRLLGMVVVAGHAPGRMLPLVWLRLVWSCLVRAAGYLVGKVPGRALDEVLALVSFVVNPKRLIELRRRTAAIDPAPGTAEVVHALRPPWWSSFRLAGETVGGAVSEQYRAVAGDVDAASLDELTGDDFSSVADERQANPWLRPAAITTALSVIAAFVAARSLIGLGSLTGPALLPAPATLSAAWRAALAPIAGAPDQVPPPWLAVLALGSTVLAGRPEWFSSLLLIGVVPLTLLAAHPLARRLIEDRRLRLWVSATYALLPVLLGAQNQGRLVLCIFAIGLPLLGLAVRGLAQRRVRTPEAWRGGWGAGVMLTVLAAFQPAAYLIAVLLGLVGALALRRSLRKIGRIGIALGLPLLVLAPWVPSLVSAPGRLFVGPDAALDGVPRAPVVWQLLIGRDSGGGLPPLWLSAVIFGVIWLLALLGLARHPERRALLAAWLLALLSFAVAVASSRLVLPIPPVGGEVRPSVGVYLLVGFGALVYAVGLGFDGLAGQMRQRSFTWLQPGSVLAGVLVAALTAGAAVWWVVAGAHGAIERTRLASIPPYVINAMQTGGRPRVLAIDLTGNRARYSVLAGDHLRLGDADRGFAYGGSSLAGARVDDLVVRLVAGTADADIGPQLADLGIGFVWATGASEDERSRIDNTPALGTASGNDDGTVWQVEPAVSRAAVVAGNSRQAVEGDPATIPPGAADRRLLLGEPADPRWRAEIDGTPLTAAATDPEAPAWQQVYRLAATGGQASWTIPSAYGWLVAGQGVVLFVAIVLAAPAVRRPEVRDPTRTARRAATVGELP